MCDINCIRRYSNREEFVAALRDLRLRELACSERMKAVRCGLASVIPLELIGLLTAEDLDLRVCGLPQIDLEYLKVGIACVCVCVWGGGGGGLPCINLE